MSRSTNRQVDPEVWFRIVHLARTSHNDAPVAAYREQTVEIALGPSTNRSGNSPELEAWRSKARETD